MIIVLSLKFWSCYETVDNRYNFNHVHKLESSEEFKKYCHLGLAPPPCRAPHFFGPELTPGIRGFTGSTQSQRVAGTEQHGPGSLAPGRPAVWRVRGRYTGH